MAKRCACDRLLETLRSDPRLKVIPAAARYVWLALADALLRLPEPGVFLLGSRVGSISDIALMLAIDKAEAETSIATLLETQLITQRPGGVFVLPEAIGMTARAAASIANGRKGGRPRKIDSRDQRDLPLVSVHEGGRADMQETREKPNTDNPPRGHARAAAALASSVLKEESKQQPRVDVMALGTQLAEIAGMDTLRGAFNFRPVEAWLAAGATEGLLIEVVTEVVSRANCPVIEHFGYFAGAVRDALKLQAPKARSAAAPMDPKLAEARRQHDERMALFIRNGCEGPVPKFQAEMVA